MAMESDISNSHISSPFQVLTLSDDDVDDESDMASHTARPWSYASPRLHTSPLTTPSVSPAATRRVAMSRYQEADIGDTPRMSSLKKQPSSSFLGQSLGKSSSQPNFFDDQPLSRSPSSVPPPRPPSANALSTKSSALDLDITENGNDDTMLKLDPDDLAQFRRWMIGFCIVNFDLEIGQGIRLFMNRLLYITDMCFIST